MYGGPSGGDPAYPSAPQQPAQQWRPGPANQRHQWDNMPPQPIPDNPNARPPGFGPPPMPQQRFQGYEGVGGFGQAACMPPPPPLPPPQGQPPPMSFDSSVQMTKEQCKDALIQFVSENCCYGKKPAQEHEILEITPSNCLHYILETFCEGRETGYVNEPFRGQPIDGPQNGPPPPPWAMPCVADTMFQDHEKKIEVPHTATVQMCHGCEGRGFNRCFRCHGLGWVRCHSCDGSGQRRRHDPERGEIVESCFSCGGDGKKSCMTCGGDGMVTCSQCDGFRRLKCFIQLVVKFTDHKDDHIIEKTDMPDELVRDVSGQLLFEQVLEQVWPIIAFPIPEINANSVRLVEQHKSAFPNEKRLQQRQQLRAISVTEVRYKWGDVTSRYWVYGKERKVHCPDYPQKCCWGCTIL